MPKYLVVTIDTETDSPRWRPEFPYTLKNIEVLPLLQSLFNRYSVRPTYLVIYPVTQDKKSREILAKILAENQAEIGAHLHPWTTPPFTSEEEKLQLSYPHNSLLEFEKLKNLTEIIEEFFHKKPISYRAGRYGLDEESLKILEELGYLVDSSVTPTMNWASDGGPNFANIESTQPYYQNSILEVPISIIVNRKISGYNNLSPLLKAALKKIGLIKTIWLRPSTSSFEEMKFVSDRLIEKGAKVLNMMFHSNELIAGASHYIKTEKEAENFFWKLDKILNYLMNQKKLESKTLSELPYENSYRNR